MVRHVRFHGRGGEGVKLASRIASRAAFLAGRNVQDSPLYGAERRGAPVVAFLRWSDQTIRERGYIASPDIVVVMDDSLLAQPLAGVTDGLEASSVLLLNSRKSPEQLRAGRAFAGMLVVRDLSAIALETLGANVLSALTAAFVVKAAQLAPWRLLAEAVRSELVGSGIAAHRIARNLEAAKRVFDEAPEVDLTVTGPAPAEPEAGTFRLPHLAARFAAPSITGATSEGRRTDGWRVFRPVIEREVCTRCFLCFALCPEGAIHLDEEHYPVVDYGHCKGCLVCVEECPPEAIRREREEAA